MSDWLRTRPATTPAMLGVWDDAAMIGHALAFEAALAEASAAHGLIPHGTAGRIADACRTLVIDPAVLADEAAHAGTLAITLVARLRAVLPAEAAAAVHRGATSQDLSDTVMMRQVRGAAALLLADAARCGAALAPLARQYAAVPALGRTLLQDALPIGFGLRIAQWHAGIAAAARGLAAAVDAYAVLQFGGAVGTRARLDSRGAAIAESMAAHLGLTAASPWHARRGGVAAIAAAVAILIGALGKLAQDVALLSQPGIGEAREPLVAGRGGSSAMAHKRNPTNCQVALSAATRAPGLVAGILAGLPAELERGLGGWQAEAPALAELFLLAGGAASAAAGIAEGLEIDRGAIARNLAGAGLGSDIGDSEALVDALIRED